ncbi:MAG TPA: hypothetical protein VGC88_04835, partial [Terriglobales bacterium]
MADPDRYHRDVLAFELRMRSQGKFVFSATQKHLQRMGDAAAIGLIKTVTLDCLRSPENMNACISIMEDSFRSPDLIEVEAD